MISKNMEAALNHQIALEGFASQYYLAMASWCDKEGMEGSAEFLHFQSLEEREHMLKLFHYLSEVDGFAITPAIEQPPLTFKSVQEVFELVFEHEKKVTESINKLVAICYKESDYNTLNFLQWYVEEQREEENQARSVLDKIKLIGKGGQSLYYIDKEMTKFLATALAAEAAVDAGNSAV
ncbi:MAG: ferritin [Maribacter sp.]|jgi:ferritin